ncbi:MAG: cytochrome c3 family protein [Actinomycetota bacterium]
MGAGARALKFAAVAVAILGFVGAQGVDVITGRPFSPFSPATLAVGAPGGPDPHGTYSADSVLCDSCHKVHKAAGGTLFQQATERETCYACHDATGGAANVKAEFGETVIGSSTKTSFHPLPDGRGGVQLVCGDCHTPHRARAEYPGLLRVSIGGVQEYSSAATPMGNQYCYACHGDASSYAAPFGDHSGFDASIHNTSAGVPGPASGSGIKCLACHASHGSDYRRLTSADGEQLCFTCHTQASPKTSGGSNPFNAFATANDYATSDGDGVRIFAHPVAASAQAAGSRVVECDSCHNSHFLDDVSDYAAGKSKINDPTNVSLRRLSSWDSASYGMNRSASPGTAQDISKFCTQCHEAPATTQPITQGANVPFTVKMVNDSSTDAGGLAHDKFSATQYFTGGTSLHGNSGGLACTACHDFHGSSNAYMLRESVVSVGTQGVAGGNVTSVTGFQAPFTYDSQWTGKFKAFCSGCHVTEHEDRGATCITCHYHGSSEL